MAEETQKKSDKCGECEKFRQKIREMEQRIKDLERDLEYTKQRREHADETIERMKQEGNGEIKGLKSGLEEFRHAITEIASELARRIQK